MTQPVPVSPRNAEHITSLRVNNSNNSIDTAKILGAVNALVFLGAAIGALIQSFLADRFGRKKALAVASICGLAGGALAAGSVAIAMLITVRILQGCGLGMLLALVPLYLTEISPPRQRGFLTGLTVMSFGMGYVM